MGEGGGGVFLAVKRFAANLPLYLGRFFFWGGEQHCPGTPPHGMDASAELRIIWVLKVPLWVPLDIRV